MNIPRGGWEAVLKGQRGVNAVAQLLENAGFNVTQEVRMSANCDLSDLAGSDRSPPTDDVEGVYLARPRVERAPLSRDRVPTARRCGGATASDAPSR